MGLSYEMDSDSAIWPKPDIKYTWIPACAGMTKLGVGLKSRPTKI